MSYRTNVYGEIKVRSEADASVVADIIEQADIFEEINLQGSSVEVIAYQISYYPEDYIAMYEDIASYVVAGSLEFTGDDDMKWLHTYENGNWIEYDGELQWVNPHKI